MLKTDVIMLCDLSDKKQTEKIVEWIAGKKKGVPFVYLNFATYRGPSDIHERILKILRKMTEFELIYGVKKLDIYVQRIIRFESKGWKIYIMRVVIKLLSNPSKSKEFHKKRRLDIYRLKQDGLSCRQISEKYKCTVSNTRARLKKAELELSHK